MLSQPSTRSVWPKEKNRRQLSKQGTVYLSGEWLPSGSQEHQLHFNDTLIVFYKTTLMTLS
jgi:hypothetical protein